MVGGRSLWIVDERGEEKRVGDCSGSCSGCELSWKVREGSEGSLRFGGNLDGGRNFIEVRQTSFKYLNERVL
jgi:hypothetical protein